MLTFTNKMHLLAVGDSLSRNLWNRKSSQVKLRKIMRKKGDRKWKVGAFRKGYKPPNKGIKCNKLEYKEEIDNDCALYIRPTDAEIGMAQKNSCEISNITEGVLWSPV